MRAVLAVLSAVFLVSLALGTGHRYFPVLPWTGMFLLSLGALVHTALERRRAGRPLFDAPAHWPLFWLTMTLYLATFRWHGGDDIPASVLPFALLRHGTLSMEPLRSWFLVEQPLQDFVDEPAGILLSRFSIVPGIMALPVTGVPVLFGAKISDLLIHNTSKVAASLIGAAGVAAVYELVRRRASWRWAAVTALFYGLGTWTFSVSGQALYAHGPAQLGLALGLLGMLKEPRSRCSSTRPTGSTLRES